MPLNYFPKGLYQFMFTPALCTCSSLFISLSTLGILYLFHFLKISGSCIVVSCYVLNTQFPDNSEVDHLTNVLTIWKSSLVRYMLKYFFNIFVMFMFSGKSSLYFLGKSLTAVCVRQYLLPLRELFVFA